MMFSFFLIFTLYATSRLHHRVGLCYYLPFFVIKEAASSETAPALLEFLKKTQTRLNPGL